MNAQKNWKDEFEEKDKDDYVVIDVWYREDGSPRAYCYLSTALGKEYVTYPSNRLVKKQKPKKYRPYRRGEVKCGDVLRGIASGNDYLITLAGECAVSLGGGTYYYHELLEKFTRTDGSPAGVEECTSE